MKRHRQRRAHAMQRAVHLRLVVDASAGFARARLQDLRDRVVPRLLRHAHQSRHPAAHDLVDNVGTHRARMSPASMTTHAVSDQIEAE